MESLNRRRALMTMGVTLLAPAALLRCKKPLVCTDTSGLTAEEAAVRTTLAYVDKSPDPSKPCSGCALYKPAGEGQCGGCQVMKGPIHPEGTCKSWVKKA